MSSSLETSVHTALFATANGYPQPPGPEVDSFKLDGIDGMGYQIHGSRAEEETIVTLADLVTASAACIEAAWYGRMKGHLGTLTVGSLIPVTVMILGVKTEITALSGSGGGAALNPGTATHLLKAEWRVQYPYGA